MNTPKAIFFGLTLIAAAIFAREITTQDNAGAAETGRYMVAMAEATYIVVDTQTGKYKQCMIYSECNEWQNVNQ